MKEIIRLKEGSAFSELQNDETIKLLNFYALKFEDEYGSKKLLAPKKSWKNSITMNTIIFTICFRHHGNNKMLTF